MSQSINPHKQLGEKARKGSWKTNETMEDGGHFTHYISFLKKKWLQLSAWKTRDDKTTAPRQCIKIEIVHM